MRGDHPLLRIIDIGRVVIEGGQRADHTDHHRHRVRVAAEPAIEIIDLLVHHRVVDDGVDEGITLRVVRQLAVEQEVRNLEEIALLGELVDGIAPM